ncbi:hypothetical protein SBA4_7060005 [Candidatus Sulfopaludibacter sp. SbA4]|nr:hypothetical protein SBA4_7060005 [Candidatus Sulfopaludibacter sp. SbA4]
MQRLLRHPLARVCRIRHRVVAVPPHPVGEKEGALDDEDLSGHLIMDLASNLVDVVSNMDHDGLPGSPRQGLLIGVLWHGLSVAEKCGVRGYPAEVQESYPPPGRGRSASQLGEGNHDAAEHYGPTGSVEKVNFDILEPIVAPLERRDRLK